MVLVPENGPLGHPTPHNNLLAAPPSGFDTEISEKEKDRFLNPSTRLLDVTIGADAVPWLRRDRSHSVVVAAWGGCMSVPKRRPTLDDVTRLGGAPPLVFLTKTTTTSERRVVCGAML